MSWFFGGKKEEKAEPANIPGSNVSLGFDPSQVSDVSSIIQSPGLFDAAKLHPLAGLDKGIEYLDLEDEKLNTVEGAQGFIPSRGWTDDLSYGTGTVYLMGLGLGGAYGFQEGVRNIPKNATFKLQLNTVLNHITKRGPYLGNSAGVLAMTYNFIDAGLDAVREVHDDYNSIAAGAISGALFRSSAGLKPMAYSTALMAGAAGLWCGLKRYLKSD